MNMTPPKVIRKDVYLQIKGPYGLSKDPRPKRRPNILKKGDSNKKKDYVKVEDEGVHRKRYNGHCTKQRNKNLNTI